MQHLFFNRHTKLVAMVVIGCFFILLGIIGLFLPILQGLLFILIGIAILAPYFPPFKTLLNAIYHRFPRLHRNVRLWRRRWNRRFYKNKPGN